MTDTLRLTLTVTMQTDVVVDVVPVPDRAAIRAAVVAAVADKLVISPVVADDIVDTFTRAPVIFRNVDQIVRIMATFPDGMGVTMPGEWFASKVSADVWVVVRYDEADGHMTGGPVSAREAAERIAGFNAVDVLGWMTQEQPE